MRDVKGKLYPRDNTQDEKQKKDFYKKERYAINKTLQMTNKGVI